MSKKFELQTLESLSLVNIENTRIRSCWMKLSGGGKYAIKIQY